MGYNNNNEEKKEDEILSFSKFKKKEYIRVILQSLYELGYNEAAKSLEQESGYEYESKGVYELREAIFAGDWKKAEDLVESLNLVELEVDKKKAIFMIKKQKYVELLVSGKVKEALAVLRNEIAVMNIETATLHELSNMIMSFNNKQNSSLSTIDHNKRHLVFEEFQQFIPSSLVIPPHRLETLIQQAISKQVSDCLYYTSGSAENQISLYQDFVSSRNTVKILDGHKDEVWFVTFSHDGKYLASSSKDSTVLIWDTNTWTIVSTLIGHEESVSFLAWSYNDLLLLSCSNDKQAILWDVVKGKLNRTFKKHNEPVTSCAWFTDNVRFVTGGLDKSINLWNIDGSLIHRWTGFRVTDLAMTSDDLYLIAVCTEQRIKIFDMNTKADIFIEESHSITSLSLSKDNKYVLVNIAASEIHLWDIENKKMLCCYKGQKQGTYVIRSCFGGPMQNYIVSGSEDFYVYVWHKDKRVLLETLTGHTATVNSVSWNPVIPTMFASASDDCTIRIWGK